MIVMDILQDKNRFERKVGEHIVYANFRNDGTTLFIDYVEAPAALRGSGEAGKLMQDIVEYAGRENLKIVPICGYAAAWLQRHKR